MLNFSIEEAGAHDFILPKADIYHLRFNEFPSIKRFKVEEDFSHVLDFSQLTLEYEDFKDEKKVGRLYSVIGKSILIFTRVFEDRKNLWVYYQISKDSDFIRSLEEAVSKQPKVSKSGVKLVTSNFGDLDLQNFDLEPVNLDIALNYGASFLEIHNLILDKLNNTTKGVVVLHGEQGTGKTTYIRHLMSKVNKNMIFVPTDMVGKLSAPDSLPFLIENKESVLIIEDGEGAIMDRATSEGSRNAVSSILNISDGILGDCLKMQFIVTMNAKRGSIDPAIMRKGRLIAEHEFKKLSKEDSNKLLESLGFSYRTSVPMSITEIYNLNEKEFKSEKRPGIGFGAH